MLYELPVEIKTYRITEPGLDVLYPVVVEMSDPAIQQQINQVIENEVRQLIQRQGYPPGPHTEMSGHYELKTNERGVLSLSLFNYTFSGGAHGSTLQKSLSFDTNTGHLYTFEDLFVHGVDYAVVLNALIRQQIAERDIPLMTEFTGVSADQPFYIADKSLVVYFPQNELTAYVYGFQYFPISVYEIPDIINEQPLGKMMY